MTGALYSMRAPEPGTKEHAEFVMRNLRGRYETVELQFSDVLESLFEFENHAYWKVLGFESEDDCLLAWDLPPAKKIRKRAFECRAVAEQAKKDGAYPTLSKAAKIAEEARQRGPLGTFKKKDEPTPDKISGRHGTSASYLARRILRDDPDVFAKLEAGEFPSVRQAAIAAGIITPPTPLEAVQKAYEKLDDESRRAFHKWLGKDR